MCVGMSVCLPLSLLLARSLLLSFDFDFDFLLFLPSRMSVVLCIKSQKIKKIKKEKGGWLPKSLRRVDLLMSF